MKKTLCLILSIITILGLLYVPIFASGSTDSGISPRLNNTLSCDLTFSVDSTGIAVSSINYEGYDGLTTHAEVSTKIQKRSFLFFWSDVDIGYPNNTYTTTIYGSSGEDEVEFQLSSKGTYRSKTTVTVYGSGGSADVIEFETDDKYDWYTPHKSINLN